MPKEAREDAGQAASASTAGRPSMLLVTARYSHHGSHSGLAPLAPQLATRFDVELARPAASDRMLLLRDQVRQLPPRLLGQKAGPVGWSPYFTPSSSLVEGAAIRRSRKRRFDVVFVESVERFHNDLGRIKRDRPDSRLVGMVHQPPGWWRLNNAKPGFLDAFDALIALSEESRDHLESEMKARNVAMINHGVDDGFFRPPSSVREIRDAVDICVVGDWLRDFDLVSRVIERTAAERPGFRWHLVIPMGSRTTDAHYRAARQGNVAWYSNISDDDLVGLYHRCHAMFLPLIDATANNALLECLSGELPVIVSDLPGVRDYAGDCVGYLASRDPEAAAAALRGLAAEYPVARARAVRGRERVRAHLAWEVVGRKMAEIALPGSTGRDPARPDPMT